MNQQENYDQIERYLANKMSAKERAIFEEKLGDTPDLRAELDLHATLGETIKDQRFQDLRTTIKTTDANWQSPDTFASAKIVKANFWRKIAAAAAVLLIGFLLWQFLPTQTSMEDLFASHFEPYSMVLTQRSAPTAAVANLDFAIKAYNSNDFRLAATAFQQLVVDYPDQPVYQLYFYVCQLEMGNSDAAMAGFRNLQNFPNLSEQATWYLGLAYLQKKDAASAKKILGSIRKGQFKFVEAQEILRRL